MIAAGKFAPLTVAVLLFMSGALSAQPSKGPPNALQGFSQNRNEPVHIEAATLEVRDKQKEATFSGDVHVTQGDTDMRCKSLVVFYEGGPLGGADSSKSSSNSNSNSNNNKPDVSKTMTTDKPGPGGEQRIKRLEARGGVVVTQKEQTATGDLGIFDMKTNTVTLTGNVTMTQGQNVLRGDRLVVDLTSGVSRVESGKNGSGRVQGLFVPNSSGPADLKSGNRFPAIPSVPHVGPAQPGPKAAAPAPAPAPAPTMQPIH
jgi:lipopolysaccharide export system protein LptA